MPPLTRFQTPQSIYSWWSDSNPAGATISIHSAAKPLMRFLYQGQVRNFIKRNSGIPLSRTTMDICFSYLAFKYISPVTKSLILEDLHSRLKSEVDVNVIVESLLLQWDVVVDLLHSSDPTIRRYTSDLLVTMASVSDSTPWGFDVCVQISSLASDDDIEVRESAQYAAETISEGPSLTKAIADPNIWQHFYELLGSSDARTHRFACHILANLVAHQDPSSTFLELKPCLRLAFLLSGTDLEVKRCAVYTFSKLSYWPSGAGAAAEAGVLEHVPHLLNSDDAETRRWTCEMLGNMAYHDSLSVPLRYQFCNQLVSRLSDKDKHVRESAIRPLWKLSRSSVGDTEILAYVRELLDSDVNRSLMCDTLANLAFAKSW